MGINVLLEDVVAFEGAVAGFEYVDSPESHLAEELLPEWPKVRTLQKLLGVIATSSPPSTSIRQTSARKAV